MGKLAYWNIHCAFCHRAHTLFLKTVEYNNKALVTVHMVSEFKIKCFVINNYVMKHPSHLLRAERTCTDSFEYPTMTSFFLF